MKKLSVCLFAAAIVAAGSFAYAGPLADATSDTLWGIELGGFVDVSYTYNFNDVPGNNGNVGRVFDGDNDEFQLNGINLYIDKLPEDEGEAGFRIDIMAGEDAPIIGDLFDNDGDEDQAIYQAYISYIAPIGNGLTIDLGRFATWYGYEVIESPANDQFSRSMLFGMAVPFTHTGLRLTYPINDMWEVSGGITQGWDVVEDNNDSVSWHGAIRWMPLENVYAQYALSYGPEMALSNDDYTFLNDLVVTWDVTEDWSVGANFDFGTYDAPVGNDLDWMGIAGYARYDVNEDMYLALRAEYFDDERWVVAGDDVNIFEVTFTLGYTVTEGLLTRLEFRHDDASEEIFMDDNGFEDTQNTLAVEVVYSF